MSARHTLAIADDVRAVLHESRIETDRVVLPARQLDRRLYAGVIKVLGEYGGRWSRKDGAILIKAADRAKLMQALESGTVQREKVIRQAFYTPDEIADRLCAFANQRVARVGDNFRVLEPSAGGGALIRAARRQWQPVAHTTAVEIDPGEAAALHQLAGTVIAGDFLLQTVGGLGVYDVVVQNAPFQKGQAVKHAAHALRFLRPTGVLAAIVPENFPDEVAGVRFESKGLPAGAFKESGTGIATKMVRCLGADR